MRHESHVSCTLERRRAFIGILICVALWFSQPTSLNATPVVSGVTDLAAPAGPWIDGQAPTFTTIG